MRKLFAALMVFCGLVPDMAMVQAQTPTNKTMNFAQPGQRLVISDKDNNLQVRLTEFGDFGVLVIQRAQDQDQSIGNSNQAILKTWSVNYKGDSRDFSGLKALDQIEPLSNANIKFDGSQLIIKGDASQTRRPAAHLVVPANLKISLYVNNQLLRAGLLNSDLMIQGNKLTTSVFGSNEIATMAQAIVGGLRKVSFAHPEEITFSLKPGMPSHVPWKTLKVSAIIRNQPLYTQQISDGCDECKIAMVMVKVDATGTVTEVSRVLGNSDIANAASVALSQWRFSPFLVNGSAVPVTSKVPVQIVNGKLFFGDNSELTKTN